MKHSLYFAAILLLAVACKGKKEKSLQYYATPNTYEIVNVEMPPVTNEVLISATSKSVPCAIARTLTT